MAAVTSHVDEHKDDMLMSAAIKDEFPHPIHPWITVMQLGSSGRKLSHTMTICEITIIKYEAIHSNKTCMAALQLQRFVIAHGHRATRQRVEIPSCTRKNSENTRP